MVEEVDFFWDWMPSKYDVGVEWKGSVELVVRWMGRLVSRKLLGGYERRLEDMSGAQYDVAKDMFQMILHTVLVRDQLPVEEEGT